MIRNARRLALAPLLALPPLVGWALPQDAAPGATAAPAPDTPLERASDPVARLGIGGEIITRAEYAEHLLQVNGDRVLRELVTGRLLIAEGERLGVGLEPGELEAAIEGSWKDLLMTRFGGDEEKLNAEFEAARRSPSSYRLELRGSKIREILQPRIVRARREVTEAALRAEFDRVYGVGGVLVDVRHVVLTRGRMRQILEREAEDPSEVTTDDVTEALRTQAEEILELARNGTEFEELARTRSHDLSAQRYGGKIQGYNYELFGPEFAAAVRAADVGIPSGPVESTDRIQVFIVESRMITEFEEVRDELVQRVKDAPPTWIELEALERELWAEYGAEVLPVE